MKFFRRKKPQSFAVRVTTTVGDLLFAFSELEKAREFSGGKHLIYPLYESEHSAAQIREMTASQIVSDLLVQ